MHRFCIDPEKICFFIVGCGALTPWAALLSAVDYFQALYPDKDIMRWISFVCFAFTTLAIALNVFFPASDQGMFRLTWGLSMLALTICGIVTLDIAIIKGERGTDLTFYLLQIILCLSGFWDGIVESSILGISLYFPSTSYQGYLSGASMAVVVLVTLRSITKAIFSDSLKGLRIGACVFFTAAFVFCLTALLILKYAIFPKVNLSDSSEIESLISGGANDATQKPIKERVFDVLHQLRLSIFNLLNSGAVIFLVIPGAISDVQCEALGTWYPLLLMGLYAVSDVLGRSAPLQWLPLNDRQTTIASLSLWLLIPPLFFLFLYVSNPWIISATVFAFGFWTGFVALCGYAIGHRGMEGSQESFIGGSLLFFATVCGGTIGSILAFIWSLLEEI